MIQGLLHQPDSLGEVLELCYAQETQMAFQAAWILDGVLRQNNLLLLPYWNSFVTRLGSVRNESVIRSFAKICELVTEARWKKKSALWIKTITPIHCELLTEVLYDWLIGEQKVAVKVFAMTSLFHLGNKLHWIDEELIAVIENQIPGSSAGFRNRGAKILKALRQRQLR